MQAQEVVDLVGLTPTDLLHVTGEFAPWDVEIANAVAAAVARIWDETADQFASRVKAIITDRIVAEIVQFLSGKTLSQPAFNFKQGDLDRWLYDESFSPRDQFLGCRIFLRVPLVGIGAPASAFLPAVAQALGTEIILPENYPVANAVGTVVGNVIVRHEGAVTPELEGPSVKGYFSRVANQLDRFASFQDAVNDAQKRLADLVISEARQAGAGEPVVECEQQEVLPGMIVQFSAWAAGKPEQSQEHIRIGEPVPSPTWQLDDPE